MFNTTMRIRLKIISTKAATVEYRDPDPDTVDVQVIYTKADIV